MSENATSVRLLRESLWNPGDSHITRLARWVPPSDGAKYWHIPRSAHLVGPRESPSFRRRYGPGVASIQFWCGVSRWVNLRTVTNREPDENRCGTCEGRAAGFMGENGLVFRPRSAFDVPRYCPAYGTHEKPCPFCGGKPTFSRSYGSYDERPHRPGELLASVAPCPLHGWKYVRRDEHRLICGRSYGPKCGHVLASISDKPTGAPTFTGDATP